MTPPPGATLHLGGHAYAHPDLKAALVTIDPTETHNPSCDQWGNPTPQPCNCDGTRLTPYPGNPRRGDQDAITASLRDLGLYRAIIVQRSTGHVLAGNHTLRGLLDLGAERVPVTWVDVDDTRAAAIVARDNRTSDAGTYDDAELLELLTSSSEVLEISGYDETDLQALRDGLEPAPGPAQLTDPDDTPDVAAGPPITQPGDVWQLGPHRVVCGDTTDPDVLARLIDGATVTLVHADPPYGMGKEAEGVANDNLYGDKLDTFQMAWWRAWAPHLAPNASAYIWGTAPDLWRLWWRGGLGDDHEWMARNEVVWDKGSGMGMNSEARHQYPTSTERCLFLMRGQQFLGNQNTADYWEGYEPLRSWLTVERDRAGWTNRDVNRITATKMAGHWFTRSQFMPIAEHHYDALTQAAGGVAFTKPYDQLFADLFPDLREGGNAHRRALSEQLREGRSYFDNTHDTMRDVWHFPRVVGAERHGHATPKPVSMVERAFLTSTREGDVVGVPFAGTCPEVIAGHRLGRVVLAAELEPAYVDVVCRRYQQHTGTTPIRDGQPVDFTGPTP